ncbi:uncharacterized protein CTRU02_204928 [Colletotrichum truncatum]|uniref:Uncharacterized protein n=1 Tax=Colletotrichum truncatum TaxID=5467 RepID=A0ACC3Z2L0_COLTU|nr:uncharacterized protein CTRU02_14012 [Colletotrichum truncatum]KAF6782693.1 hypothetical protein CTRU02_14012 [Colletotrichum truncatum]
MAVVKSLATGFTAWATKQRSPGYSRIYAENDTESLPSPAFRKRKSSRWLPSLSPRMLLAVVASILLFSCILFTVSHDRVSTSESSPLQDGLAPLPAVEKGGPRRLRVIVPADGPSPDLCKMLMSGLVSGYPSPVIVNWGRDFHKSPGWFGGSHLGKIDGALDFLDAITSDQAPEDERLGPDDLVIVVDAYDLWFQLPPSLLIRRYMAQNYAADQRIRKDWGADSQTWFSSNGNTTEFVPKQSIIISTQKKCWPDPSLGSDPHCDKLPQSTAREDLYGSHTDEDPLQFHDVRPRYVNSGSFMGPVGDMRRMLRRAQEKVEEKRAAGIDIFSDQGIFAEIFGEQEMWRTSKREHRRSGKISEAENAEIMLEAAHFDYGVGLDYIQDLFTPTVFEEDDGEYIVLSNKTALEVAANERVIIPPRVEGVPEDMLETRIPLSEAGINTKLGWADVPLYTDFWTTSVPVIVHHNAHRNGLKGLRLKDWWKNNWFFPYLRHLMEFQARPRALEPLFKIMGQDGAKDLVYWAPASDANKRKPRIFNKEKLKKEGLPESNWNPLCTNEGNEEWWKEVFQDGKGSVDPESSDASDKNTPPETEDGQR